MEAPVGARWLLLIHQIPPTPGSLRVRAWRRLQKLGAVAIKSSVYVLPRSAQAREDFEWVLREIVEGGGEASICEASFVAGLADQQIEGLFHAAREADYAQIMDECRAIEEGLGVRGADAGIGSAEQAKAALARLRRRLEDVLAIDFFEAPRRLAAMGEINAMDERLRHGSEPERLASGNEGLDRSQYRGRTWVTRAGVRVDRMASAWLIRRFIDPEAHIKLVPGKQSPAVTGELRFDMFEAEFTHEGDRCTFETLLHRFPIADPGLQAIAEIVHDVDLKDSKFGRQEAAGIARLIDGIAATTPDDEARLAKGEALFDGLVAAFGKPGE